MDHRDGGGDGDGGGELSMLRQCLALVLDPASGTEARREAESWLWQQRAPALPALLQLAGEAGDPSIRQLACWAARHKIPALWPALADGERQAVMDEVLASMAREQTLPAGRALAELAGCLAELQAGGGGGWPALLQYLEAAAATDGSAPAPQRALSMALMSAILGRPTVVALLHPFWPQLLALPAALLSDSEAAVVSRALDAAVRLASASKAVRGGPSAYGEVLLPELGGALQVRCTQGYRKLHCDSTARRPLPANTASHGGGSFGWWEGKPKLQRRAETARWSAD